MSSTRPNLTKLGFAKTFVLPAIFGRRCWRKFATNAADERERRQWREYEARFRDFHEHSLPFRFLPATDEERIVVARFFPEISFVGKEGTCTLDYEKIRHEPWPDDVFYSEIKNFEMLDGGTMNVHYERQGKRTRTIRTQKFPKAQKNELLAAISHYYGRYVTAVEYQRHHPSPTKPAATD